MSVRGAAVACDDRHRPSRRARRSRPRRGERSSSCVRRTPSSSRACRARRSRSTRRTSDRCSCGATSAPGICVVEVGTGPAALTLALLRAVGPTGQAGLLRAARGLRRHGARQRRALPRAGAELDAPRRRRVRRASPSARSIAWSSTSPSPGGSSITPPRRLRPGGVLTRVRADRAAGEAARRRAARRIARFGAVETFETLLRFWHVGPAQPASRSIAWWRTPGS